MKTINLFGKKLIIIGVAVCISLGNTILFAADNWKASANASPTAGVITPTDANSRFGIGITTTPASNWKVELKGNPTGEPAYKVLRLTTASSASNITLSATPTGSGKFFVINNTNTTDGIIFSTGDPTTGSGIGSEKMRILASNGNVGIGTTNPGTYKLNVTGANTRFNGLTLGNNNGSNTADDRFYFNWASGTDAFIRAAQNVPLRLQTNNGSSELTLLANGNVGIGTAIPNKLLHLSSNDPQMLITDSDAGTDQQTWGINSSSGQFIIHSWNDDLTGGEVPFVIKKESGNRQIDYIQLQTDFDGSDKVLRMDNNGNVSIGTTDPGSAKLAVNGTIRAREVIVTTQGWWPDRVFKPDYDLKPLHEVEKYIKKNSHLEGIPSEKEVMAKGVLMGEMQAKLLQKLEETTLYLIEMKKENEQLKARLSAIEQKVK